MKNIDNQIKIDFDKQEKTFEEERTEIATKFKVADKEKLIKENGIWYYVSGSQKETVEEWDRSMKALEGKTPDDFRKGQL